MTTRVSACVSVCVLCVVRVMYLCVVSACVRVWSVCRCLLQ